MHWKMLRTTDRPFPLYEALGVTFLLGCAAYLSLQLVGVFLHRIPVTAVILMLAALLLLYGCSTCFRRLDILRELLVMAMLGYIGMLLGLLADYGESGLLALSGGICRAPNGSGWAGWWNQFSQAPWTHAGMFIGCNLGGCWRRISDDSSGQKLRWMVILLANIGMLLGMSLSHALPIPQAGNSVWQLLQAPVQMSLLMAVAMLIFREMALSVISQVWPIPAIAFAPSEKA